MLYQVSHRHENSLSTKYYYCSISPAKYLRTEKGLGWKMACISKGILGITKSCAPYSHLYSISRYKPQRKHAANPGDTPLGLWNMISIFIDHFWSDPAKSEPISASGFSTCIIIWSLLVIRSALTFGQVPPNLGNTQLKTSRHTPPSVCLSWSNLLQQQLPVITETSITHPLYQQQTVHCVLTFIPSWTTPLTWKDLSLVCAGPGR